MLATSLSQDLYRRFVNPTAADRDRCCASRAGPPWRAGRFGILIALVTPTIVGALSVFYAMLGATLFVPILVALHARVEPAPRGDASILAGAAAVLIVQFTLGNTSGQHLDAGDDRPAERHWDVRVGVGWRSVSVKRTSRD